MTAITITAEADHRPDVYVDGDRVIYRASALGGCLRALVAARLGYDRLPFDDQAELRMAEGNLHEPAIVASLEDGGWTVVDQQREVELVIGDRLVVRGHIDGVGAEAASDPARVVEIKAMGEEPFKKWMASGFASNPRYAWQISTYMAATGLAGVMVVKNRNSGAIIVDPVDEAPIPAAQIKARVARVEAIARTGELPDCDTDLSWGCPFRYLHDDADKAMLPVEDDEVDALAAVYDRARTMATQADAMKKTARDRLAEAVRDRKKVRTSAWSVSCSMQKRTTVDLTKLKAEVDVSPYEVTTETETVRVTAVGDR